MIKKSQKLIAATMLFSGSLLLLTSKSEAALIGKAKEFHHWFNPNPDDVMFTNGPSGAGTIAFSSPIYWRIDDDGTSDIAGDSDPIQYLLSTTWSPIGIPLSTLVTTLGYPIARLGDVESRETLARFEAQAEAILKDEKINISENRITILAKVLQKSEQETASAVQAIVDRDGELSSTSLKKLIAESAAENASKNSEGIQAARPVRLLESVEKSDSGENLDLHKE